MLESRPGLAIEGDEQCSRCGSSIDTFIADGDDSASIGGDIDYCTTFLDESYYPGSSNPNS